MRALDIIQITALAATLCNAVLTVLVLARDSRSTLNRIYMAWGIAVTLWNLGVYHLSQDIPPAQAFMWAKVLQLGVMFIPVILFHLCMVIAQIKAGWIIPALYLAHVGFAISLFCNEFIIGVRKLDVGYWSVPGPGFFIFGDVFYTGIIVALIFLLYRKQKTAAPVQRKRLRALLAAIIGLTIFGTNDLLPILGHDTYPGTHIKFFPLGSLAAMFYVVIIGYSVLQHRLLDFHVTLSRFAAQLVRLGFMMLVGFLLLLLVTELAPDKFTAFSFGAAMAVLLSSALVASLFFPQFFGKGSDALERQILGDRFEYHAQVQNLIQTMRSFPEPQFLLQEVKVLLADTIKARCYDIILLDDTTRAFKIFYSHPLRTEPLADMQLDSPLYRYFQQTRTKFLSCNPLYETDRETPLQREARHQISVFEPEYCFPFFVGNDLIGVLILGAKGNEDLYTPHDLRLLGELTSSLGLVLNQVRLRQQLQVVHEQDLLGRMSRGLAHDLNNLLTPVQTLLQLFSESRTNHDVITELLPISLRNLETVRTYVNEALFFSRTAKLHGKVGLLDEVVREAMSLVHENAQNKNIGVSFAGESEVAIEMDAVLIKRLLCNLLSNAVDASPVGSSIEIELTVLPKSEANRDWHRLKVIDHGEGISAENLQRVFTPYFTTKNTGDGKRGFGLGLAIARNIVHLHGGNLSIASKEKKGTTVQVDLPSKLNQGSAQPQAPPNARRSMVPA